jgi:hypothetical protein
MSPRRNRWPKLTPVEIEERVHTPAALAQLISARYAISLDEAQRQVQEWLAGQLDESVSPREESRLEGEDAGKGDPRQDGPTVG